MTLNTWWLISDEDTRHIGRALDDAAKLSEEICNERGCMCDLEGRECWQPLKDARHHLDSGLHVTDAVPADFRQSHRLNEQEEE